MNNMNKKNLMITKCKNSLAISIILIAILASAIIMASGCTAKKEFQKKEAESQQQGLSANENDEQEIAADETAGLGSTGSAYEAEAELGITGAGTESLEQTGAEIDAGIDNLDSDSLEELVDLG